MKMIRPIASLSLVLLFAGCTAAPPPAAPLPPAAATAPPLPAAALAAHENLNAVLWSQLAAEHDAISLGVYNVASRMLDVALADPSWTALPQTGDYRNRPPAVIVDVDETVLDNAAFNARLIASGRAFSQQEWLRFVEERAGTPMPGALEFARRADALGVTIAYVTNRRKVEEQATFDNLVRAGFPIRDQELLVMREEFNPGGGGDKSSRRDAVAERFRILLLVGDDLNDFVNAYGKSNEERNALVEANRELWGTRWHLLPNPMYGSWERAVYVGLPRDAGPRERLQRKIESLETNQ